MGAEGGATTLLAITKQKRSTTLRNETVSPFLPPPVLTNPGSLAGLTKWPHRATSGGELGCAKLHAANRIAPSPVVWLHEVATYCNVERRGRLRTTLRGKSHRASPIGVAASRGAGGGPAAIALTFGAGAGHSMTTAAALPPPTPPPALTGATGGHPPERRATVPKLTKSPN